MTSGEIASPIELSDAIERLLRAERGDAGECSAIASPEAALQEVERLLAQQQ